MRASLLAAAMMIFAIAPFLTRSQTLKANSSDTGLPTFYRDVQPILQRHCQSCHRPGEIAPMPLHELTKKRSHLH